MKREYIVAYEEAYADGVYFAHPIGELGQELVRCKECRHCKKFRGTFRGKPINYYHCNEQSRDVESDGYCSWGEREGE